MSAVDTLALGRAVSFPLPAFWVASIAAFVVSLDTTMPFAAFDALRHAFGDASAAELSNPSRT